MVAHVAHSFASKTKFRNQKEAKISYGKEDVIKLRNSLSENLLTKILEGSFKILTLGYHWATDKSRTLVDHT